MNRTDEKIRTAKEKMDQLSLLDCNERGLSQWYLAVDKVTEETVVALKDMVNWK